MFDDAKLKVQRGARHVRDLKSCLDDFLSSEVLKKVMTNDPEAGVSTFSHKYVSEFPEEIPLIMGDAIHNFRASLDHAFVALGKLNGRGKGKSGFPFRETLVSLQDKNIKKDYIKEIGEPAYDFIIKNVKPYKSGNYPLWALNTLDNMDKHKLIIPIIEESHSGTFTLKSDDGGEITFTQGVQYVGKMPDGFSLVSMTGNVEYSSHGGTPTFEAYFGSDQCFTGSPVIQTLNELEQAVRDAIKVLETFSPT